MREFFGERERKREKERERERGGEREQQTVMLPVHGASAGLHESLRWQKQRPATEQMSAEVRELWASLPRGTETCRALRVISRG
jgi:hypothetical protein